MVIHRFTQHKIHVLYRMTCIYVAYQFARQLEAVRAFNSPNQKQFGFLHARNPNRESGSIQPEPAFPLTQYNSDTISYQKNTVCMDSNHAAESVLIMMSDCNTLHHDIDCVIETMPIQFQLH